MKRKEVIKRREKRTREGRERKRGIRTGNEKEYPMMIRLKAKSERVGFGG
jgi:hypothetical protein